LPDIQVKTEPNENNQTEKFISLGHIDDLRKCSPKPKIG
jgi:hypothetical protein